MAERDAPPNLLIMGSVVAAVVGVTGIVISVQQFFSYNVQQELSTKVYQYESPELKQLRAQEEAKLNGYQWVDKEKGVVRIPLQRAMELTLAEWKTRPTTVAAAPAPEPGKKLAPEEVGKQIWSTKACNACHTLDGAPGVAPTFKGLFGKEEELADGTKVKVDEAYIKESILNPTAKLVKGFAPVMPPMAGQLKDEEVDAVIALIKSLK
ncbi:MAG: cytochrome c [Myxococcota bacterium]